MLTGDKTDWFLLNGHMDGSEFSKKGISSGVLTALLNSWFLKKKSQSVPVVWCISCQEAWQTLVCSGAWVMSAYIKERRYTRAYTCTQACTLNTFVYPWLIHVNVCEKPLQYCKVISLQLRKKKKQQITEYSDLDPSQYVSEPKAIFSSFSLTRSLRLLQEVRKCSKDLHRSLFI